MATPHRSRSEETHSHRSGLLYVAGNDASPQILLGLEASLRRTKHD